MYPNPLSSLAGMQSVNVAEGTYFLFMTDVLVIGIWGWQNAIKTRWREVLSSACSVGGPTNQPALCVPADNYRVPTESSIHWAGDLTGSQEMSSWLPIVIRTWRARHYVESILHVRGSLFLKVYHCLGWTREGEVCVALMTIFNLTLPNAHIFWSRRKPEHMEETCTKRGKRGNSTQGGGPRLAEGFKPSTFSPATSCCSKLIHNCFIFHKNLIWIWTKLLWLIIYHWINTPDFSLSLICAVEEISHCLAMVRNH